MIRWFLCIEHLIIGRLSTLRIIYDSCIPFNLFGDSGDNITGTIPFCTHTKTAGTSFSVHIDTKIRYRDVNNLLAYNIQVASGGQGSEGPGQQ